MTITNFDAPVLIAGGGLVGLSAAMFLAQHGVRSLAIERRRNVLQASEAARKSSGGKLAAGLPEADHDTISA